MALPDLKNLTGAAWRDVKKKAGVKGANFFDSASSKAVADKIDKYQQKRAAYKQAKTKDNFLELFGALDTLGTALAKAESDRGFKSDLAKEMQADIGNLLKEVTAKKDKLSRIANDEKAMELLVLEGANEMNRIIDQIIL